MNAKPKIPRRQFLATTGLCAAAVSCLGAASTGQTRLRAAVIGHTGRGDYGHSLDTIFANRPNIELVGLADPDPAGRAKTAQKIKAPRSYADYRELLEKERPQLVSLAMRQSDQHHAIALAALKSGAHIYCEKPFTTTPAEADELLAEARKRGLKIAVAHTTRMSPTVRRLKQGLDSGYMGELLEMRAHGKQDTRAGGEDMMVLGTHLFDLMRMMAGDPLWCQAEVLWKGKPITRSDGRLVKDNVGLVAGDEVFARYAFPKGVRATFTSRAKLREPIGHWGIEFIGTRKVVCLNNDISPNVFLRESVTFTSQCKTEKWIPFDETVLSSPPDRNPGPVGDWLEAITQNREPECSGANGAWAVEMVLAAYQSALKGAQVTFPLSLRTHPLATG